MGTRHHAGGILAQRLQRGNKFGMRVGWPIFCQEESIIDDSAMRAAKDAFPIKMKQRLPLLRIGQRSVISRYDTRNSQEACGRSP
ncbi:hypothetical protein GCM10027040_29880 [Halomonas shantousis]